MSTKNMESGFINIRAQKIRVAFIKNPVQSTKDLMQIIKVAEKDLHRGMKFLKTKNSLVTEYDKKTKTYTMVKL